MSARVVRRLTEGEVVLAASVFSDLIDYDGVRLAAAAPFGYAVTLGRVILFPPGSPGDFAQADLRAQAWLIHELTHVWQFATAPRRALKSWAKALLTGGYGPGRHAYRYTLPLDDFAAYGLEQQASIVEHAFLLRQGERCGAMSNLVTLADFEGKTPFLHLSRKAGEVSA